MKRLIISTIFILSAFLSSAQCPVAGFSFGIVDSCSIQFQTVAFNNTSMNGQSYHWDFGDGSVSTATNVNHVYTVEGLYSVKLVVTSSTNCKDSVYSVVRIMFGKSILPTAGALILSANYECTDADGWTNYFFNNNTPFNINDDIILLSLKKNGNNIGSLSTGMSVQVSATAGAGSNTGILLTNPLITNSSGFWVMNRYWHVNVPTQPTTPVGVRFYYNTQDLTDVNGSYPLHNLNHSDLLFYKTVGGNPDPTTNLQGASRIISIVNGLTPDTTHWVYSGLLYDKHVAEFQVASFSGGGGGATGNGTVLPIKLNSFRSVFLNKKIQLLWSVENYGQIDKFIVEKSLNGSDFNAAGEVNVQDHQYSYQWTDERSEVAAEIFYRLTIIEKDGFISYSKTVKVSNTNNISLSIYPNPAKTYLIINSPNHPLKNASLTIRDQLGRVIYTQMLKGEQDEFIQLPTFLNGYYYVSVRMNNLLIGTGKLYVTGK